MSPRDPRFDRFDRAGAGGGKPGGIGGFGGPRSPWASWGRPPSDLLVLVVTLFATFALQFFAATAAIPALLRLTPLVWRAGFVWQLVSYPFIGYGEPGIWILVELAILFMFGRDVYAGLGRKRFWRLVVVASVLAAAVAVLTFEVQYALAGGGAPPSFPLIQGQRVLMAIFVAAFATANRRATILLFFVLPIEARHFLWIEVVFAFVGYLAVKDLGGFLGICAAVGLSYLFIRDGGFGRSLRQTRLRMERWWLEKKLQRLKRRRGLRVVKSGPDDRGPVVH
jgi:membrane associated rhomboid family serine protease